MFVGHIKEVSVQEVINPGHALNVAKQILVGPDQGWMGWAMRAFTISGEGYTPRHTHPWPHINYVISGKGTLHLDGKNYEMQAGSIAYIPDNAEHQFSNHGPDNFVFICIVPEEGEK